MKLLNKIENYAASIIFILLVALPFSDLLIRELLKPIFSGFTKIPASQTLVSHLTLLIGFSGAIIASRDDKLLSLSNYSLFDVKQKGYIISASRWLAIFITLLLLVGSIDLLIVELSFGQHAYIAPYIPRWLFQSAMPIGFLFILIHLLYKIRDGIFSKEGLLAIVFGFVFLFFHDFLRGSIFIIYLKMRHKNKLYVSLDCHYRRRICFFCCYGCCKNYSITTS